MTVIVYRCDTCKRTKEVQQNITGLEIIQRCTITHGCRGKLQQVDIHEDFIRGSLPVSVSGLNDWQQRKMLFNHIQPITRTEWIITHNMRTFPSVSVFVDKPTTDDPTAQEKITPDDIVVISENEIKLNFDRAYSGVAQLVARSSGPDIYQPSLNTNTVEQFSQFSNNSIITIATKAVVPNVKLKFSFLVGDNPLEIEYDFDDQPSIGSPWVNYNRVVIQNNTYKVRSVDLITPEMENGGNITDGTSFNIIEIDDGSGYRNINKNEAVILLASDPFEVHDKIENQYIDCKTVIEYKSFYTSADMFISDTIIQNTYPPIRSV